MAASGPNITGKSSFLTFFLGQNPLAGLDVESWKVKRLGDSIDDGVCGEKRTRKGFETTGYSLSIECFNVDMTKLDKLLEEQKSLDDLKQPDERSLGIVIKPRKGGKKGYTLGAGTIDDWEIGAGGQTARVKLTLPIRFDTFEPVTL